MSQKNDISFTSPVAPQEPVYRSFLVSPEKMAAMPRQLPHQTRFPLTSQKLRKELRKPAVSPTLWKENPASRNLAGPHSYHTPSLLLYFLGKTPVSSKSGREETSGRRLARLLADGVPAAQD